MTDPLARVLAMLSLVVVGGVAYGAGSNDANGQQNVRIDRLERAVRTTTTQPPPTTATHLAPTPTTDELANLTRMLAGSCGAGFTVTVDRAGRVTGHCLR